MSRALDLAERIEPKLTPRDWIVRPIELSTAERALIVAALRLAENLCEATDRAAVQTCEFILHEDANFPQQRGVSTAPYRGARAELDE